MKTGTLQRRWSEQKPDIYDKEKNLVRLDIQNEKGNRGVGEEQEKVDGYGYYEIEIDRNLDYGHVKSQLIEAGFAQKDEFGLLMNAMIAIIDGLDSLGDEIPEIREVLSNEDIVTFVDFCEYRKMCADAAKAVIKAYE